MDIDKLANEYLKQYEIINAKMDGLKPLLCVYKGQDLFLLRRKLKIYYDMAIECRQTAEILSSYYDEEGENCG